ncbi:MAG: proton-conducting transporter membrane subunit, partial [Kineosporiaceae bacterium]
IGYMMLGLGLGTPLGVAAALLHTLNHGLFKGGLFLGAGAVQHATGTRDLDRLGGLSRRMPATTALWLTSSAGISGIPLFNGFVSKLLLYIAALQAGFTTAALVAWVTSILTLFTFLRATSAMFFGEDGPASPQAQESPRVMLAGSALLGAGCLVLGIAPQLALDPLIVPALAGMGLSGDLGVGWFGFVASGDIAVAAGLGLAVLSVVLGYALHRTMARTAPVPATAAAHTTTWAPRELVSVGPAADALPPVGRGTRFTGAGSPFTGGEPHLATGYPRAGDFSRTIATGLAPIYTGADPDRYYRMLWHGLLRVTERVGRGSAWLERRAIAAHAAATVLIGVVAAVFAGVTRPDSAGYDGGSGHTGAVPWPFLTAVALALLSLLLALADGAGPRRGLTPAALTGVAVLAGLVSTAELPRLLLFEVAAFGAVVAYLAAAILSAGALLAGTLLRESGPAWLVLALLLTGFAVKFALVPAYLWLPVLAARAPAALVGFVIAVVDLAAFAELADLRRSAGWLFTPRWPWLTLALLTIGAGGLLALADRDLKRVLAFTAVSASGLLLLGVGGPGPFAADGARALAAADALAAALLFGAVAAAERDRWAPDLASRGLARRHPLAAAAFVAGSLTALGVPFTAGFTGHWRLYATALDTGWPALVLLIGTTLALLLAHARIIAVVWWGGPEGAAPLPPDRPRERTVWRDEPPRHTLALVFLLFGAATAGFFPVLLLAGGA